MKTKLKREITKFSRKTDRLTDEYPVNLSSKEMKQLRKLFLSGDDYEMLFCYEIRTPEQMAFFKTKGIPITNRSDFYLECYI